MRPTRTRLCALLYPTLFLSAFLFISAGMHRGASIYDEGLILTGSPQIDT